VIPVVVVVCGFVPVPKVNPEVGAVVVVVPVVLGPKENPAVVVVGVPVVAPG